MVVMEEIPGRLLTVLTSPTPAPAAPQALLVTAGIVLALVVVPPLWRYAGLVVTVVHELGHGLTGLLRGRRRVAIRVSGDHSGLTSSRGTAASAPFSTFWGYPAPAVVGALFITAACFGRAGLALVLGGALLLVCLVFMRGFLAIALDVLVVAAACLAALYVPGVLLGYVVGGLGLFLLVGAYRGLGNLLAAHRRRDLASSDAAILAQATGVPAWLWIVLMALVLLAATSVSARLVWNMLTV